MTDTFKNLGKDLTVKSYNNPSCINCNECCSMTTSMTKKEYNHIIELINTDKKLLNKLKNKIIHLNQLYKKQTINFKCIFTNEKDYKCLIYCNRPEICRIFHCDNYTVNKVPEEYIYTILDVFNYIIDIYFAYKKDYLELRKVYKMSCEQYFGNALGILDRE